jgi:hypothetical protein
MVAAECAALPNFDYFTDLLMVGFKPDRVAYFDLNQIKALKGR